MAVNRVILIVLDSLGIGAQPDAGKYNDSGANTFGHILDAMGSGYDLPNLRKMGLYNCLASVPKTDPRYKKLAADNSKLISSYGVLKCKSPAKDSTVGHWELMGLETKTPLPVYPKGFPEPLIKKFEKLAGTKTLGNCPASGTAIINELGAQHLETGFPIVYTSADSVFQVAAHEGKFGLDRLYRVCRAARKMLKGKDAVGRVIARPFTGTPGAFTRTTNRKDFSLKPFKNTLLDEIKKHGGEVVSIGKVSDLFNHSGVTKEIHTSDNIEGMKMTLREARSARTAAESHCLIFTNLVEFDMNWGHRRDTVSYAAGLKDFDVFLPDLICSLSETDALILTADHGCDPTYKKHTDHTREYVPVMVYGKSLKPGVQLGVRPSFCDVAMTIQELFGMKGLKSGKSFLKSITREKI